MIQPLLGSLENVKISVKVEQIFEKFVENLYAALLFRTLLHSAFEIALLIGNKQIRFERGRAWRAPSWKCASASSFSSWSKILLSSKNNFSNNLPVELIHIQIFFICPPKEEWEPIAQVKGQKQQRKHHQKGQICPGIIIFSGAQVSQSCRWITKAAAIERNRWWNDFRCCWSCCGCCWCRCHHCQRHCSSWSCQSCGSTHTCKMF